MKTLKRLTATLVATSYLLILTFNSIAQNIGISSTGVEPDNSALLDLNATDKGFLITRTDTLDIPSPAFGLMTLSTSDSCLYMYSGKYWISLGGVGSICKLGNAEPSFPCNGSVIPIINVTSTTGKVWMDRNLGAAQIATSVSDAAAYGDLYQWG